ncbi:hypothetical protein GA0074692_0948 [Micromonospora pallida]|uniref:Uncharacterized protein n=1 Tax=Micromonospora pallida TaxID=145854 RepID=A0A1C6RU04_9ACTN|nr:hypothetical protein [Micromonospora pallida]SCL20686.1 hypothetical protein GA0074692_0948 [Micromonospora pallida]
MRGMQPHPTVMRILNNVGVARYATQDIEDRLRRDAILMCGRLTTTPATLA